ncbi:MAG: DDE-type integrase/transposase/recombinase [Nitrosopumilus sp.]|nr:DDE-type integrase/transposase/recombinase [Nitrosopumilus sp.]NRA05664.1 DDE-type integrase/transposase/recombinase [Nitrosopumilus sp.]
MSRNQKATQIFSKTNSIRKISKNHYAVESQNSDIIYNVKKLAKVDVWACECKDFHYRLRKLDDKHCKHIQSCILLQDSINTENKIEQTSQPQICPNCHSSSIVKNGFRKLKNGTQRQKHRCNQCRYRFILGENGFSKVSSDPKIISESLNLVMSGMSYRNIARRIETVHQIKISHVSVNNWIKKYTELIKEYVDTLNPNVSDVWSLDEMYLNVKNTKKTGKGFHDWLWSIIDPKTRFLIATEVSKKREISDARKIIASGKKMISKNPNYVLTDCLNSYQEAIRKEFENKTAHVKTKSLKEGFVNRPIERYHNEIRENLKARRGLGNDESAQTFSELLKINHNFVKPHQGLDGKKPAQAANIELNLGPDKYLDLIKQAGTKVNFVNNLGKRIKKVTIVNEGDSIKITPKTGIDKKIWREINDILKLHEFGWLSNGKDSCWLKLIS